jgi:uncharacterized protein
MQANDAFERVEQALEAVDAEFNAAQTHGMLCGMLGSLQPVKPAGWIAQVLVDTQPSGESARECLALLSELYARTVAQMDDDSLQFQLLLPDDTAPLKDRAEALGHWCDGFLYGMGLGSLQPDAQLPAQVREALRDLGEIAQVEINPAPEEENEQAYAQLVEYVRVAALLIMEALRPAPQAPVPPQAPRTLH